MSSPSAQTDSGAHLTSCPQGTGESLPKCKATGHEADNLLTHSAEVKNEWSYTSTPYALSWSTQ